MNAVPQVDTTDARRWLGSQSGPARRWIFLSVGFGLVNGGGQIGQAYLLSQLIGLVFMGGRPPASLRTWFTLLILVIVLRALCAWGRETSGFRAGAAVRSRLRAALLRHVVNLGPTRSGQVPAGALSSTVFEQVESLHDYYAHYLPQLALAAVVPLAIAASVLPLSWVAGGLLLATAPLIPFFMVLIGMGAESISQRHFQALSRLSAHFLDVLQGLPTLKLLDQSRAETARVADISNRYRRRTMSVLRVAFLSSAVLEFFSSIAIALVAVYLGLRFLGYIDFGATESPIRFADGFFILLLAPDFYAPLRELGTHYHARASALGAAEEIRRIFEIPALDPVHGPTARSPKAPLEIECRGLEVVRDIDAAPILTGVDFRIRPREKVALVGHSGAGKTTLLDVILGFTAPSTGQVRVNSSPLSDLAGEDWRRQVAWIGQHPVLFHGSIRDNILLGRSEAGAAEVESAARDARVWEFSRRLPDGLDTAVGERGLGLSRGQAQRVALARAFLKQAPVLLLDEPSAGLDAHNERLVMEALERLWSGCSVLMVTHRLDHLARMDRVMVLMAGRIVEEGPWGQLAAAGGPFARLAARRREEE